MTVKGCSDTHLWAAHTRPKATTPIGRVVAVLLPEIIHDQDLRLISESNHADFANADQNIIKGIVSLPIQVREVLDMRIISGGDCCSRKYN
jgi:hypothetical protein